MYELVCLPVGRHIKENCAWQFHSLTCHTPRILGGGELSLRWGGGGRTKLPILQYFKSEELCHGASLLMNEIVTF